MPISPEWLWGAGGLGYPGDVPRDSDRITSDPAMLGGRRCIRGMRIPVSVVLEYLADGASIAEILAHYPALEPEDIRHVLKYAAREQ